MKNKVIYIDIDGTICSTTEDANYEKAKPIHERIVFYNKLYENNHIVYWTARGSTTKIDWTDITLKQLKEWGVKYHEVILGKPFYDVFIDDKCFNPNTSKYLEELKK